MRRVLDHYLHTACRAAQLLAPTRDPITLPAPPGTVPEALADDAQALAWLEAEYPVLLAAITLAAGSGLDTSARLRLVGVRATGLLPAGATATQLAFGEQPAAWRDAEQAVDKIAGRFGTGTVRPAALVRQAERGGPPQSRESA